MLGFELRCSLYLWEYIGDLSQDLLECSYNEADIRHIWVKGQLDKDVADMLRKYPHRLEHYRREDGRYSDQLTALVILAGGWTSNYGPEVIPLTPQEQIIVNAFTDTIICSPPPNA